jgi:hypothetical protein
MVGSCRACFWRESGVRLSVLCLCVWQQYAFSRRENVFTFNLLCEEVHIYIYIYIYVTFNGLYKGNAEIDSITVQQRKFHPRHLGYLINNKLIP